MSRRFGKGRVPGCECTTRFTCGACLRAAPPYFHTPNSPAEPARPDPVDIAYEDQCAAACGFSPLGGPDQ